MSKNYIEIKTRIPFTVEYMYIDFIDESISAEQFSYREVNALIDNSIQLVNENCPHLTVRCVTSFNWYRDRLEEGLQAIGRKIDFKYPDELKFFQDEYKRIDKILEEWGI